MPDETWPHPRGVVAMGASSGGIDALHRVLGALPKELPVAICVVLHIPATSRSLLAEVIARRTALPVVPARHRAPLRPGCIHVAPPDRHIIVRHGYLELDPGPKENGVRPAIDPLFRSMAATYGPRGVAVVLSGALSDGSSGARTVAEAGGVVLAQDPYDAMVPSMPEAAVAVARARTFPAEELAAEISRIAEAMPELNKEEVMALDEGHQSPVERSRHRPDGPPAGYTCPECRGPLWEFGEGELVRYRCRVGHIYYEDHFLEAKGDEIEASLWSALEALEERAELLGRVSARMSGNGNDRASARFRDRQMEAVHRAEILRTALLGPHEEREVAAG
jgi:two-component system, chemotaxis family, protein-glutamate methylesterase/glutaminase